MSGVPVIATKWEFLYRTVLVAVARPSGVFFGSSIAPGHSVVCVWTTDAGATAATEAEPDTQFDLLEIAVRDLMMMLPDGVGVVIDPGTEGGITIDAAYAAELKRLAHPFPGGAQVVCKLWSDLPDPVREGLVARLRQEPSVEEVHAFLYTIDDSPYLGCLAYVTHADAEGQDRAVAAISSVLDGVDRAALEVASVSIVGLGDVPDAVRATLPPETRLLGGR